MMRSVSATCFAILLLITPTSAQHHDWIVSYSGGEDLSGVSLGKLNGDSLEISQLGRLRYLNVGSVAEIRRREGNPRTFEGIVIGALLGGGAGYLLGNDLDKGNAYSSPLSGPSESKTLRIALGVGGGVLGGFILGTAFSESGMKFHKLQGKTVNQKRSFIDSLLMQEKKMFSQKIQQGDSVYLRNGGMTRRTVVGHVSDSTILLETADSTVLDSIISDAERIPRDATASFDSIVVPSPAPFAQPKLGADLDTPGGLSFALHAGVELPTGDFGESTGKGAGQAKTGFCFGADMNYPISESFAWLSTITVSMNSVDISGFGLPSSVTSNVGSWFCIWPMTGIRMFGLPSSRMHLFVAAQIGLLIGNSPEANLTVSNQVFRQASASASSFAYGFGAGVVISDRFMTDLKYLHGEPEYEITAIGGGISTSGKVRQSTSVLRISAGIIF